MFLNKEVIIEEAFKLNRKASYFYIDPVYNIHEVESLWCGPECFETYYIPEFDVFKTQGLDFYPKSKYSRNKILKLLIERLSFFKGNDYIKNKIEEFKKELENVE